MTHEFKPKGVCSTKIIFDLGDDNKITNLRFKDGCDGNLKAVSILAEGMDSAQIINKLKGTRCGRKRSSCPDQLALAVEQAQEQRERQRP